MEEEQECYHHTADDDDNDDVWLLQRRRQINKWERLRLVRGLCLHVLAPSIVTFYSSSFNFVNIGRGGGVNIHPIAVSQFVKY
jgi:hypothetical protein